MRKKIMLALLAAITAATCAAGISACYDGKDDDSNGWGNVYTVEAAYAEAKELGYAGSLDEFIQAISGKDGQNGQDGKNGIGIDDVYIDEDGRLVICYSDSTTKVLDKVTGEDGKDGQDGKDGVSITGASIDKDGNLVLTLSDGNAINCGRVVGADGNDGQNGQDGSDGENGQDGKDGIGIDNVYIDEEGKLVICYSDGTSKVLDRVIGADGQDGQDGQDGASITKAEINAEGHLVLTFNDGHTLDCGSVAGENGAGVDSVYFNENGELIIHLTDGEEINCGKIPVCTHSYSEWQTGMEATCTSIGYETRTCSICGNVEYNFIEATGHTWNSGYIINTPTCDKNGLKIYGCLNCSTAKYEELAAIGHSYVDGICENCGKLQPSEGLEYANQGTYSVVIGIGTCTDTNIVIADEYEGLPVADISISAFEDCNQIIDIYLPDSIKSIGFRAFANCTNLRNITMHGSIENFGTSSFLNCSIHNLYFEGTIQNWCSITIGSGSDSSPMTVTDNLYISGELISGELIIPEGVTDIASYAFYDCNLTSVTIPSSVTRMRYQTFYNNNISKVIYKGTIEQWCSTDFGVNGNDLFYHQPEFYINGSILIDDTHRDLVIPDTIEKIRSYAFYGYDLENVTIPVSVKSIGFFAFNVSADKTNIYYQGTLEDWLNIQFDINAIATFTTSNGYSLYIQNNLLTDVVIPESITTIGTSVFGACTSITSVTIHDNVTYIASGAFRDCSNLSNIKFSKNITEIGTSAFSCCINLTNIILPDKLTKIESQAFFRCPITDLVIPETVTYIDGQAFYGCSKTLNSIVVAENNQHYYSKNNCLIEISSGTLILGCNNSIIPDDGSVQKIGYSAFLECGKLEAIVIPSSVITIEQSAFNGCYNLKSITILSGTITIDYSAFYGCSSLTTIIIPNSVTVINSGAFSSCDNLQFVYFQGSEEDWSLIEGTENLPENATLYYYSEIQPTDEGNYWHYAEDGVTPVIWTKETAES